MVDWIYLLLILEGWDPVNRFNNISWVAIVTPIDRRNRSFWWRFRVVTLYF